MSMAGRVTEPRAPSPRRMAVRRALEGRGYSAQQVNGQLVVRVLPHLWDPRPAPNDAEIYISGLPEDFFEDEILPMFMRIGLIYEFRLLINYSGMCRGAAFIMFTNNEDAKKAINVYNNHYVRERKKISISMSVNNCRIQILGIPLTQNIDFIGCFIYGGTKEVKEIHVKKETKYDVLIEYETHRGAALARKKLASVSYDVLGKAQIEWGQINAANYLHQYQFIILRHENGLIIRDKYIAYAQIESTSRLPLPPIAVQNYRLPLPELPFQQDTCNDLRVAQDNRIDSTNERYYKYGGLEYSSHAECNLDKYPSNQEETFKASEIAKFKNMQKQMNSSKMENDYDSENKRLIPIEPIQPPIAPSTSRRCITKKPPTVLNSMFDSSYTINDLFSEKWQYNNYPSSNDSPPTDLPISSQSSGSSDVPNYPSKLSYISENFTNNGHCIDTNDNVEYRIDRASNIDQNQRQLSAWPHVKAVPEKPNSFLPDPIPNRNVKYYPANINADNKLDDNNNSYMHNGSQYFLFNVEKHPQENKNVDNLTDENIIVNAIKDKCLK